MTIKMHTTNLIYLLYFFVKYKTEIYTRKGRKKTKTKNDDDDACTRYSDIDSIPQRLNVYLKTNDKNEVLFVVIFGCFKSVSVDK